MGDLSAANVPDPPVAFRKSSTAEARIFQLIETHHVGSAATLIASTCSKDPPKIERCVRLLRALRRVIANKPCKAIGPRRVLRQLALPRFRPLPLCASAVLL